MLLENSSFHSPREPGLIQQSLQSICKRSQTYDRRIAGVYDTRCRYLSADSRAVIKKAVFLQMKRFGEKLDYVTALIELCLRSFSPIIAIEHNVAIEES